MEQYERALAFWDENFSNAEAQEIIDWNLGSKIYQDILMHFCADKKMILDFGCGNGWASHFFAANSNANIIGIDQSMNAVKIAKETSKLNCYENTKFLAGNQTYLKSLPDDSFDAAFSNNVFDVIPTDLAETVFEQFKRILKPGAEILIALNYELTDKRAEEIKMKKFDKNCFELDGNLRAVNYSVEDWKKILGKYFEIIKYKGFNYDWDTAKAERRIFFLKNKK